MSGSTAVLAEHYQKTYDLTLTMWEQRNRTYMLLLLVVGAAALLTFQVTAAEPLLVGLVAKVASTPESQYAELRKSFPYGLVQTILLMVILYLLVILYHRTTFLQRCYSYLGAIEPEIHRSLELPAGSKAFTRESSFYQSQRSPWSKFVGVANVGMLGVLLAAFLGNRIHSDFASGSWAATLADIALAVPTVFFFVAYARAS